jgi:hypothetical protein
MLIVFLVVNFEWNVAVRYWQILLDEFDVVNEEQNDSTGNCCSSVLVNGY